MVRKKQLPGRKDKYIFPGDKSSSRAKSRGVRISGSAFASRYSEQGRLGAVLCGRGLFCRGCDRGRERDFEKKEASFDIVYQDAFSPKKNPELWTLEYFSDIKRLLAKKAVITTYSKATPVRLALYELGFNLYEHPRGSVRGGTIASNFDTKGLQKVDMLTKIKNAPNSKVLRDQEKG